ncbi:MAG: cysteine protease StiP family protein [Candidatus Nanopelagicales bacterium]
MIDPGPGPLYGPEFSSFASEEVGWLLADYSHLSLERDVAEREAAIQSGKAHYADDLPNEARPTAGYTELFDNALERNATIVAEAVANTAGILAEGSANGTLVLVSLARAGVPAGIWLQDRLRGALGADVHHYAISIVRDRGIDLHALSWLGANHDPASVYFVDGWTGKGTIRNELTRALQVAGQAGLRFPDRLAVIADPAQVADIAGTREDILLPTACLNSTSCGLISRTVLPRSPASGRPYHGAKQYTAFAEVDRSRASVDRVTHAMRSLGTTRPAQAPSGASRRPTVVHDVASRLGIQDLNLIKPGIGETTRVLQRRVPWQVLVHPDWDAHPDLAHVFALAERQGTAVVIRDTSPYRCIGVIRPLHASPAHE